ncbi:MAG: tRNA (adenosine(37)-N6)-threonylcarbamoyltransferase complex ATPase subunit type 1 TsaE [Candidatus Eremiobacteraeota bacterium]|nr:tRNA (adenosine(37)-N6)-threonylcarbamoyltransferase complex ATPase subunit type 1 TsaE [Candidatus Eremiobacteraeota bacterium]
MTVSSRQAMRELAAALAQRVRPGDVITIRGALGSGKTTFVGGLAAALVGGDPATSPTFTFRQRYGTRDLLVEHLDLYRVEDESDLLELGLEEAFGPNVVTVIEWPERAPSLAGKPAWRVEIVGCGDAAREVTIAPGA